MDIQRLVQDIPRCSNTAQVCADSHYITLSMLRCNTFRDKMWLAHIDTKPNSHHIG